MGLAYEIVINSNPCIAYLMEDNTLPMQALVTVWITKSSGKDSFPGASASFALNA